ncbi:hypothetical protein G7B40_010730 [Aetokthonos hydrillicola Thurmond2011]|jgi:hypothetical protein|uniref:Uncharacterized protein n=1 Tax=Aetokthonos hydrillicola Thurmond2011 TaxID=2712845 RepID=A0AAP5M9T4_9CYAN|nr:hypothetical protein [Aetokthonos hydrillicola]MBO3459859.1 hypothetical protein [Aetokthonos hydrillicola CCALA 1050]MBW4588451.1 hypothetical protein [Aetokthonos hydrillicola CCALA 1050]MDR9895038.1 hypothetical protein [Aetokthonos hydrillicola Thurmond2011]
MSSQISSKDLSEQAEDNRDCAKELMIKRDIYKAQMAELQHNHAPESEIKNLKDGIALLNRQIPDLLKQAIELDAQDIIDTIQDLNDAWSKIKASTEKVKSAVKKLNNIKSTLKIVGLFLDLGNAIIGALAKTNPVAQIEGIIQGIDTFTQGQQALSVSRGIEEPEETVPVVDSMTTTLKVLPNTGYTLEISIKIQPDLSPNNLSAV